MSSQYDFDTIIDRHHTGAMKTDVLCERYGREDLIPLWIADMDFAVAPCITDALVRRLQHPVYGYAEAPASYWQSIIDWLDYLHGWKVKREWITYIPGIVKGIGLAVNVFSNPGDKIIIQTPVYTPFMAVPESNGRQVVHNPLKWNGSHYEMDFDHLESIIDSQCKLFILCNPHNPGGVVWPLETLQRIAEICARHNILIIADEIHADMPLFGAKHHPFASVSETAAQNSISFGAPSKTFNIAGLVSSYAIVPNETIRKRFFDWLTANELNEPTFMATIATEAAYNHCREWREQMLAYIEQNILFVEEFLDCHIPAIKAIRPQASFIVWLDCTRLHLEHDALIDLFVDKARLALNDGEMFGPEGKGHMRLNVGTPRAVLQKALEQLRSAVNGLKR
ncbi:MalY/PatB family protein [Barnesiella intestinihominis]|uniref:MalY/PatB family protein n=1 Tax=Barnesiella intestinihominis TaxID=487174 RepID=UPI003AB85C66